MYTITSITWSHLITACSSSYFPSPSFHTDSAESLPQQDLLKILEKVSLIKVHMDRAVVKKIELFLIFCTLIIPLVLCDIQTWSSQKSDQVICGQRHIHLKSLNVVLSAQVMNHIRGFYNVEVFCSSSTDIFLCEVFIC